MIYYYINPKVWGSNLLVNVSQLWSAGNCLLLNLKMVRKENFFITHINKQLSSANQSCLL